MLSVLFKTLLVACSVKTSALLQNQLRLWLMEVSAVQPEDVDANSFCLSCENTQDKDD